MKEMIRDLKSLFVLSLIFFGTLALADGYIRYPPAGGGGGVTDVTASSPLASTGGTTPNISLNGATAAEIGYLSGVTSAIQPQLDAKASAVGTINAVGYYGTASTFNSTSVFRYLSGSSTLAIGSSHVLTAGANAHQIVAGNTNTVSGGTSAIVAGNGNTVASASNAIIGGSTNDVSGGSAGSLVMGSSNVISGLSSGIAVGTSISVSNSNFSAIFGQTQATTSISNILLSGEGHTATRAGQALVGRFSSPTSATMFAVGNGTSGSALSNAFRLDDTAVGIFGLSVTNLGTMSNTVIVGDNILNVSGSTYANSLIGGNAITLSTGGGARNIVWGQRITTIANAEGLYMGRDVTYANSARILASMGGTSVLSGSADSLAVGSNNNITGALRSIIAGTTNTTTNGSTLINSALLGTLNSVSGTVSRSIIATTTMSYNQTFTSSIGIGTTHTLSGAVANSMLLGQTNAVGAMNHSIVGGTSNNVAAAGTIADSIMMGTLNELKHNQGALFGTGNVSSAVSQLLAGTYANPSATALFEIGYGSGSVNRATGLRVESDGRVYVGNSLTTLPTLEQTFTVDANAGTGGSCSGLGSASAGVVNVVTGTSTSNGAQCVITLNPAFVGNVACTLTPASVDAGINAVQVYVGTSSNTLGISFNTAGADTTTYTYYYHCIGF